MAVKDTRALPLEDPSARAGQVRAVLVTAVTSRPIRAQLGPRDRLAGLVNRAPARARQFIGWFALGVVAFGCEVMILGVLHQWLRCPLWLASALAAECVLLGRFLSTDRLVFGHTRPTLARCGRFHAAAVGSFAVSWVVLNGSAGLLGAQYVIAAFLGSVAAFAWSALSNFLWVWRPRPQAGRKATPR